MPFPDLRRTRAAGDSDAGTSGSGAEDRCGEGVVDEAGVVLMGERNPVPVLDVLCVLPFPVLRRDNEPDTEPDLKQT